MDSSVCGMNIGASSSSINARTLNTTDALEGGLSALEASLHTSAAAMMVAMPLVSSGDLAWRIGSSHLYQAKIVNKRHLAAKGTILGAYMRHSWAL